MAPLPYAISFFPFNLAVDFAHDAPTDRLSFAPRDLGSEPSKQTDFNPFQMRFQEAVGVTFSIISMIAGMVALYWFFHMRASFRQRLIMLLIVCDMSKSLWIMISGIVALATGPIQNNSPFCKASGFLLSFGVEAADFAILVIAIHAALCIFRPRTSLGESGLYPYRRLVYLLWLLLPGLAAGLAFVHQPGSDYSFQGTVCYLSVRPFWYRLALAWIPRYLILITIIGLYLAIFLFVRRKLKRFENDSSLKTGGPRSSLNPSSKKKPSSPGMGVATWDHFTFPSSAFSASASPVAEKQQEGSLSPHDISSPAAKELETPAANNGEISREKLPSDKETVEKPASPLRRQSITSVLRDPSPLLDAKLIGASVRQDSDSSSQLAYLPSVQLVDSGDRPIAASAQSARNLAIARQLRFLFVYPLVYFFIWLPPFVQNCLQYTDWYARSPSFWFATLNVAILTLHCAIDSFLFSWREKPWRHPSPGGDGDGEEEGSRAGGGASVISSLSCWSEKDAVDMEKRANHFGSASTAGGTRSSDAATTPRGSSGSRSQSLTMLLSSLGRHGAKAARAAAGGTSMDGSNARSGKSKGERVAEARAARRRRELERADARSNAAARAAKRKMSLMRRGGREERSWWDVEGLRRKDSVLLGTAAAGAGDDDSHHHHHLAHTMTLRMSEFKRSFSRKHSKHHVASPDSQDAAVGREGEDGPDGSHESTAERGGEAPTNSIIRASGNHDDDQQHQQQQPPVPPIPSEVAAMTAATTTATTATGSGLNADVQKSDAGDVGRRRSGSGGSSHRSSGAAPQDRPSPGPSKGRPSTSMMPTVEEDEA